MPKSENGGGKVKVKVVAGKVWSKDLPGKKGKLACVRASDSNPVIEVPKAKLAGLRGQVEVVPAAGKPVKPANTRRTEPETGGSDTGAPAPAAA